MITYSEFLEQINIISESEFDEIIESLPDCDINDVDFDLYNCINNKRDIADTVINAILGDWDSVWTDSIDVDNHSFELCDVECLSDLEEIKETFSKWTISNYEEIKNNLLEEKKSNEEFKERKEKEGLFNSIINKISLDDLKKLVNDYTK